MDRSQDFVALYDAVQKRPRPEDVAELVLKTLGANLTPAEKRLLDKAAAGSLHRMVNGFTSMAQDFARPSGAERQVRKAAELFVIPDPPSAAECLDAEKVRLFMERVSALIHRVPGEVDFLHDRLDRAERKTAGLKMNHRQYNKRWRLLRRLEKKIGRMVENAFKFEMARMSKSAFATKLSFEEFSKDIDSACFMAYITARMNVRSVFTNKSQERSYDEISEMLLKRAKAGGHANWFAIAHVHPEPDILKHITDEEKGRLMGMATNILGDIATFLHDLGEKTDIDYSTLIVKRGNDSTTWNQAAGAWNKARDAWMALLFAMGAEELLDVYCPGKVMRLMAADVVYWHSYGKGSLDDALHPDTKIWRDLPKPWEVFHERATCTRAMVEAVCAKYSIATKEEGEFPTKHGTLSGDTQPDRVKGWTGLRASKTAAQFKPTPELVHGVTISSPFLAITMRKLGWFSAKPLRADPALIGQVASDIVVERDEAGAAIGVHPREGVTPGVAT